jgi:ankyrin repeat protein
VQWRICFERTSIPSYKLLHAVNTGDTASVSTLLSTPDAQSFTNTPNESGCTPLHLAVVKGNAAVTKQLLAARCNVDIQDDDGYTPLHNAASYDAGVTFNGISLSSVTEQLIDARCNMNLQDLKGCTPLCISALQGHESVTKKLLLSRCNVDLQDKNGHTALQVAQRQGHAEIAKLIRRNKNQKGADRAMKDALLAG